MADRDHERDQPRDFGRTGSVVRVVELGAMVYGLAEADSGKLWVAAVGAVALGTTVLAELAVDVFDKRQHRGHDVL